MTGEDLVRGVTYLVETVHLDSDGRGTAFAVTPRHLLTARHVVEGAESIAIVGPVSADGAPIPRQVSVLWSSETHGLDCDVAILELDEGPDLPLVPLLGSPDVEYPNLSGFGFSSGKYNVGGDPFLVKVLGGGKLSIAGPELFKLEGTPINSGVSGSPLFDAATGFICGVVVVSDLKGVARAFPTAHLFERYVSPKLANVNAYLADRTTSTRGWGISRIDRFGQRDCRVSLENCVVLFLKWVLMPRKTDPAY